MGQGLSHMAMHAPLGSDGHRRRELYQMRGLRIERALAPQLLTKSFYGFNVFFPFPLFKSVMARQFVFHQVSSFCLTILNLAGQFNWENPPRSRSKRYGAAVSWLAGGPGGQSSTSSGRSIRSF